MPEPMRPERRAEIAAALAAVPAPPWAWCTPDTLVTDHSGRQCLLTTTYDVDGDGTPTADLLFRSVNPADAFLMLTAAEMARRGQPNPVGDWLESSGQFVAELLAENERVAARLAEAQAALFVDRFVTTAEARTYLAARAEASGRQ